MKTIKALIKPYKAIICFECRKCGAKSEQRLDKLTDIKPTCKECKGRMNVVGACTKKKIKKKLNKYEYYWEKDGDIRLF